MSESYRKNILILEADRDVSELFARAIEARRDYKCYLAEGEEEAADLMYDIPFDLTLVDLAIAVEADFRFLKQIKRLFPDIVVILAAFLHQKEYLNKALSLGAHGFIFKPIKLGLFRQKMDQFFLIKPAVVS
jgi:response regulator of citrate/malate metabolism